jgi:hypothetical protein
LLKILTVLSARRGWRRPGIVAIGVMMIQNITGIIYLG